TPEEATQILKQLTGGQGPFRDFAITKDSSIGSTTWKYDGTVDLTGGLTPFGDPKIAPALSGDAFGGQIAAIEQQEKKPATQMVALNLSVELPGGQKQEWKPTFADPKPTQIAAQSTQSHPVPLLPAAAGNSLALLVIGGLIIVGVVG